MPELRDALREATNKLGVLAGNPQLIAFDAMLTSYPALTVAGAIAFGVNPANAFAGATATIEVIANGANVPTFTGITATGSYVNTAGAVNRIEFECLPSGPGSALAFYAQIGNGGGAAPVTSVAGKTGAVTLVKGDVGLGAVDNTADADKPVSSAVQSAINGRQPIDSDLTAIAGLTANGFVRRTGAGTADTVPPSTSGLAVLTGDPAAARGAIGLSQWLNMPGSVITIPLALVPETNRTNQPADGSWKRLTYVSYTGLYTILQQYPGALGKSLNFKLMVFGVNQLINQDANYEAQPWWDTGSNAFLGRMEYTIGHDWVGAFDPPQRYVEYYGDAADGSSMAVLPITIPSPETTSSTNYWSLHFRGTKKYPALAGTPAFSIYSAFLIGVI